MFRYCYTSSIFLQALVAVTLMGCTNTSPPSEEEVLAATDVVLVDTRVPVKVTPVRQGEFSMQLLTNGKVTAARQVDLKVRAAGRIVALPVRVGQYVQAGELLCHQEDEKLQLELEQHRIDLQTARIKLDEAIIVQGGRAGDTSSVPAPILTNLKATSGYTAAQHRIRQTQYDLAQTRLYAPFAGIIANLQLQQHQDAQTGEVLCTLIDPGSYEITFTVLEQDAHNVQTGQPVRFSPQFDDGQEYTAAIYRIEPIISDQGLLTVRAKVQQGHRKLYVGMNTRVLVEDRLHNQLIVPKSALVLRSNREVIFVADTSTSLAKWKYVTVAHRNDEGLAIADGLEPGDLVIVEGNLNLAHDAEINIQADLD